MCASRIRTRVCPLRVRRFVHWATAARPIDLMLCSAFMSSWQRIIDSAFAFTTIIWTFWTRPYVLIWRKFPIKVYHMHGREVCRARGGARAPPRLFFFEDRQNISTCPPPRFFSCLLNWLLAVTVVAALRIINTVHFYSVQSVLVYCINTPDTAVYVLYIMYNTCKLICTWILVHLYR